MLRKGSELQKKDKEVLLDLDYKGSTKSYGSLQNRNFIAQKSVSTLLLWNLPLSGQLTLFFYQN